MTVTPIFRGSATFSVRFQEEANPKKYPSLGPIRQKEVAEVTALIGQHQASLAALPADVVIEFDRHPTKGVFARLIRPSVAGGRRGVKWPDITPMFPNPDNPPPNLGVFVSEVFLLAQKLISGEVKPPQSGKSRGKLTE
ncbi:MAG: hypothetical protein K2X01_09220 [Cyanobacteria bacterium]|nr:hypothetical protein [Cyanobacteriota bacterium]